MSAIADIVTLLASSGISAEFHGKLIDLVVRHGIEQMEILRNSAEFCGNSAETAYEKRLRKDRERKRKTAENSAETKKTSLILTSFSEESLQEEEVRKKEESKKERRAREKKRLGPLPENWQPPDIAYALATEFGTTVPSVEAIFRDYLKSSGKLYADHDAAFCNFVRNQRKFNGQNHGTSKTNSGGSLIAAIDRELAELQGEKRANFELPEGNIRRLSHGPVR